MNEYIASLSENLKKKHEIISAHTDYRLKKGILCVCVPDG